MLVSLGRLVRKDLERWPTVVRRAALAAVLGSGATLALPGVVAAQNRPAARAPSADVLTLLFKQTLTPTQATRIIEQLVAKYHTPGLAVAVLNRAEPVYVRTFGYRDVARKAPLTDSTVMPAGTFTSAMFAYLVMQLVDQHTINLNTPIATYVGDALSSNARFKAVVSDTRFQKITPRMLLMHTGGITGVREGGADSTIRIVSDPGTRFDYSDAGIDLLGLVVERVTKRPLATLMSEMVFAPAGMTRTSMTWNSAFASNAVTRYDSAGKPLPAFTPSEARASNSAVTTIRDMTRVLARLLGGGSISLESRTEMFKPQVRLTTPNAPSSASGGRGTRFSYGLGWDVYRSPIGPVFFSRAHDRYGYNYMGAFDDAKTAIILMANGGNTTALFKELRSALIGDSFTPAASGR
jgi:CubicO group peptidase (beta-lactamase class C family)